jgi:hypothetical protein
MRSQPLTKNRQNCWSHTDALTNKRRNESRNKFGAGAPALSRAKNSLLIFEQRRGVGFFATALRAFPIMLGGQNSKAHAAFSGFTLGDHPWLATVTRLICALLFFFCASAFIKNFAFWAYLNFFLIALLSATPAAFVCSLASTIPAAILFFVTGLVTGVTALACPVTTVVVAVLGSDISAAPWIGACLVLVIFYSIGRWSRSGLAMLAQGCIITLFGGFAVLLVVLVGIAPFFFNLRTQASNNRNSVLVLLERANYQVLARLHTLVDFTAHNGTFYKRLFGMLGLWPQVSTNPIFCARSSYLATTDIGRYTSNLGLVLVGLMRDRAPLGLAQLLQSGLSAGLGFTSFLNPLFAGKLEQRFLGAAKAEHTYHNAIATNTPGYTSLLRQPAERFSGSWLTRRLPSLLPWSEISGLAFSQKLRIRGLSQDLKPAKSEVSVVVRESYASTSATMVVASTPRVNWDIGNTLALKKVIAHRGSFLS